MIKKYHVHIYKVVDNKMMKAEIDTLAYNSIKAKEMTLEAAKSGILTFGKSDCDVIAIEFEVIKKEEDEKK